MLIPPEVNLFEALKPLREDLLKLEKGVSLLFNGKTHIVRGAISTIVADHIQAIDLCRHLGCAANLNSRLHNFNNH